MSLREPLTVQAAKKLIKAILAEGAVNFTKHAREEMAKDKLTEIDVVNVLREARWNLASGRTAHGATGCALHAWRPWWRFAQRRCWWW